jgi:translation initiation factor RLI1
VAHEAGHELTPSGPEFTQVGFEDHAMEGPVNELSGGWRMKLAIACAMLQGADFLMLDEPTNHLDVNAVVCVTRTSPFMFNRINSKQPVAT